MPEGFIPSPENKNRGDYYLELIHNLFIYLVESADKNAIFSYSYNLRIPAALPGVIYKGLQDGNQFSIASNYLEDNTTLSIEAFIKELEQYFIHVYSGNIRDIEINALLTEEENFWDVFIIYKAPKDTPIDLLESKLQIDTVEYLFKIFD